jgi:hypothetical protein
MAGRTPVARLDIAGVGPQRTGSTWLYMCLREHPQLCFPRGVKETFFLDQRFDKGWPWYWSHFQHHRNGQLCAEIGPTYFDVPDAAIRLQKHNPRCRIIISLRDPAARTFSLYLHYRKLGQIDCNFREAIEKMARLIDSSRYRSHIASWVEMFGRERVLVILLEDISSSPLSVLGRICNFLRIDLVSVPVGALERVSTASLPAFPALAKLATVGADWLRERRLYGAIELAKKLGLKHVYRGSQDALPTLEPKTRKELIEEFQPDISYVEELLGRPLPEWRRLRRDWQKWYGE